MRISDVIGTVMVGPSSSHTAGAVRIGFTARRLLGEQPADAEILLHGSFAATGRGHGTDRALVAGLLGMKPDDQRIPRSFEEAEKDGMTFSFGRITLRGAHPNTAKITMTARSGRKLSVVGSSIGGGRIRICEIDGIATDFSGETNTLIVRNSDVPGCIAGVTEYLSSRQVNIAAMRLFRDAPGGYAVMVLECDEPIPGEAGADIGALPGVLKVTVLNREAV